MHYFSQSNFPQHCSEINNVWLNVRDWLKSLPVHVCSQKHLYIITDIKSLTFGESYCLADQLPLKWMGMLMIAFSRYCIELYSCVLAVLMHAERKLRYVLNSTVLHTFSVVLHAHTGFFREEVCIPSFFKESVYICVCLRVSERVCACLWVFMQVHVWVCVCGLLVWTIDGQLDKPLVLTQGWGSQTRS